MPLFRVKVAASVSNTIFPKRDEAGAYLPSDGDFEIELAGHVLVEAATPELAKERALDVVMGARAKAEERDGKLVVNEYALLTINESGEDVEFDVVSVELIAGEAP